jgi:ADP-ribose pyrophosphatase
MKQAWEIVQRKILLDRKPWMRVLAEDVRLPDGRNIPDYLHRELPDFVVILAQLSWGEIGLIRSYKHGLREVDIQPPAGYLEPGEGPLACAQRELREETGLTSPRWLSPGEFSLSGNRGGCTVHILLAKSCQIASAPVSDDLEEQEVPWLPIEQIREMWLRGSFKQLGSIAALGLALTHLEEELRPV